MMCRATFPFLLSGESSNWYPSLNPSSYGRAYIARNINDTQLNPQLLASNDIL